MVTFHEADNSDAEDILQLQREAYQSEARLYNDWSIPPLVQTLEELQEEFHTLRFLKAVTDDCLVGSVRACLKSDTVEVGRLIVDPAYQGRGIGTELLNQVESLFKTARRYELFTGSKSEANIRLYEKHGYSITRREKLSSAVTILFLEKNME